MSLTKEQLLAPRWEVIADYPYSPWEIGDILCADKEGELHGIDGIISSCGYPASEKKVLVADAEACPNIFRPLNWGVRRMANEMPKYIKDKSGRAVEISEWICELVECWKATINGEEHKVILDLCTQ